MNDTPTPTPTPRTDACAKNIDQSNFEDSWKDDFEEFAWVPADFARTIETELTAAREELETERIRLAACGVVAMADTKESRTKAREMLPQYRSASLSDVERRVDECIELREQRDKLAEALNKMISICSCKTEDIDTVNEIRDFVDTITKHSNP